MDPAPEPEIWPAANGSRPGPRSHTAAPAPADRLLNAAEVAEILGGGITAETVIRRWRNWELRGHRIGKQLRWWQSDVYTWISNHPA
jgi:predicted DNA-binding transcriptional regulator AlpA